MAVALPHPRPHSSVYSAESRALTRLLRCWRGVLQGKIRQDGSGFATFKATFQCITFRPFKGEVLDCVVSQVNKVSQQPSPFALWLGLGLTSGQHVRQLVLCKPCNWGAGDEQQYFAGASAAC